MGVTLHWFLPTNGDSRTDLSLGNAVGVEGSHASAGDGRRLPSIDYLGQIARSAEQLGFDGALTPTSSWCEDPWVIGAALSQVTRRLRFLLAVRPGLVSPTIAAQMAASFQRVSGGRLLLNVVVGGDDDEQLRYGDALAKEDRYRRAAEWLEVFRRLWDGAPVDFAGEHVEVAGAHVLSHPVRPRIYLGGSSRLALEVTATHADVFLTWGEPPAQVQEKIARVDELAAEAGRDVRHGIRLNVISRQHADDAWAHADRLLAGLDPDAIARQQAVMRRSGSEGQHRMLALHGGRTDALEVAPNLWAGFGLVRGGAGTGLVGSHVEVADRIAEYHALGIDEFILSAYPHLEELYDVGEGVIPELRRRGLLHDDDPADAARAWTAPASPVSA